MSDGYLSKLISEFGALKERITELEKSDKTPWEWVQDLKGQIEVLRDDINANTELTREFNRKRKAEITTLQIDLAQEKEYRKYHDFKNKEVLKELMKAIKDIHPNLWERLNKLLEKLK